VSEATYVANSEKLDQMQRDYAIFLEDTTILGEVHTACLAAPEDCNVDTPDADIDTFLI